ncbi:MAG: hypothetical protein D6688_00830 [Alphaproteobacteria bacterium]|nr:MAG: hypothetical protein D6688_00830 [Alphaproteobacteria bacterium]
MMHLFLRMMALCLVVVLATGGGARAGDLALLIGNEAYRGAPRVDGAASATRSAPGLRGLGYETITGVDLGAGRLRAAFARFMGAADEADRVVVLLAGHFVRTPGTLWFVPVDAAGLDGTAIASAGLNVDDVIALAGRHPGGAVVLLAEGRDRLPPRRGLEPGIGRVGAPNGVLVASGRVEAIESLLRERLVREGLSFAEAVAAAGDGVRANGFVSRFARLTAPEPAAPAEDLRESAFFDAVSAIGTIDAFEAYLRAYPEGRFAAAARERIADLRNAPLRRAEAAEKSLNLSLEDRRRVQRDLTILGYDTRGVDGIFGPGTRAAIKAWQAKKGHEPTGFLDAKQLSQIAREAAARRARLAAEDDAFWQKQGGSAATEAGLRRYLAKYPDGRHADEARRRLAEIERARRQKDLEETERRVWREVSDRDTIPAYRRYLDRFPDGPHAAEARARIRVLEARQAERRIERAKAEEEALNLDRFTRVLIQQRLLLMGLAPGRVDGVFDERTRAAIRRFQERRGLPVTGYVTKETLDALLPRQ